MSGHHRQRGPGPVPDLPTYGRWVLQDLPECQVCHFRHEWTRECEEPDVAPGIQFLRRPGGAKVWIVRGHWRETRAYVRSEERQ